METSTTNSPNVYTTRANDTAKTVTQTVAEHIFKEIRKVIVGQEKNHRANSDSSFRRRSCPFRRCTGDGKNLMVKTLARILGVKFTRIQFTPDLMPSDITGTNVFNIQQSQFYLRHGPIFTDILLANEIDRTPPKTQAVLLEAMEERQVTIRW